MLTRLSRFLTTVPSYKNCRRKWIRFNSTYEAGGGKTTVSVLNQESDALMIDAYSQVGFVLNNGVSVLGPMIIFPRSVLSWNVPTIKAVSDDTLALFAVLEPKIDIIVFGCGDPGNATKELKTLIFKFSKKYRFNVEVLPTETACSTFNFLNSEQRCVAGALIPPQYIDLRMDDVLAAQRRRNELYKVDTPVF